jgi:hypothetical protein
MSGREPVLNSGLGPPRPRVRRMVAGALVLTTLIVATLSLGAGAPAVRARRAPYPDVFPPGPGEEIAERSCRLCHSAMLVTQQAKDSTGWEKTLALMEKWGAPATPAEHDTLRQYLLMHFGPRPTAR